MTFSRTRVAMTLLWLVVLALWIGCGKSGPETVQVKGLVTLDGNPVPAAGVMFAGPEGGTPVTAVTDAQGQFVLNSPVGANAVAVSKIKQAGGAAGKPAEGDAMLMPAAGSAPPAEPEWVVPQNTADSAILPEVT